MNTIMTYASEYGTQGTPIVNIGYILAVIGLWKMFTKAGEPGWIAIIPFYNIYTLCKITMNNPWYWVRIFVVMIPVVGWIAAIYFYYQICKATALSYGKPAEWAFGYLLLTGIFYCITGFGDAEYYGPYGSGDGRTDQERQAKTVDFDVVKNDSEAAPEKSVYDTESLRPNQYRQNGVLKEFESGKTLEDRKSEDVEFTIE